MKDKVLSLIQQYHMIAPGDHVICALSGGKDSMCLLHLLLELQDTLSFTLSAAHLNHQLRGDEALRDQAFVKDHCLSLGIPFYTKSRDVRAYAAKQGLGLEEAARELRYDFLLGLSPNAKIATAHNAEDNLETMLMHLVRGCGPDGLSGIPPCRGRIIRPLLLTQRREIEAYLALEHIPHVEDSTNDLDFCIRNRLRHQVLPALREENPGCALGASKLCLQIAQDQAYLNREAEALLARMTENGGLSLPPLLQLPDNMALRVLKAYLAPVLSLSRVHLEDALRLCHSESPSARISLPGNWLLCRVYDRVELRKHDQTVQGVSLLPVTLPVPGSCRFGEMEITCHIDLCPSVIPQNTLALKLPGSVPLSLRVRKPGDRLTLPGGTKKISRYLMDQKIPAHMRNLLPVLTYGDAPAALLPLAADKNFRARPGEDSLILTVHRMEDVK